MTKENKDIFNKLVRESVDLEFKAWAENVDAAKKLATENGAQFIDLSIKPFQENIKPLQENVRNSSEVTKKIYDDIRSLAQ